MIILPARVFPRNLMSGMDVSGNVAFAPATSATGMATCAW